MRSRITWAGVAAGILLVAFFSAFMFVAAPSAKAQGLVFADSQDWNSSLLVTSRSGGSIIFSGCQLSGTSASLSPGGSFLLSGFGGYQCPAAEFGIAPFSGPPDAKAISLLFYKPRRALFSVPPLLFGIVPGVKGFFPGLQNDGALLSTVVVMNPGSLSVPVSIEALNSSGELISVQSASAPPGASLHLISSLFSVGAARLYIGTPGLGTQLPPGAKLFAWVAISDPIGSGSRVVVMEAAQ